MHIAEGVLSAPVLITGAVVAAAGVAYGLKKIPANHFMLAGLLGAAFFVASLIHVPIGFSSAHLILNGLLGVVLGWAAFPGDFRGFTLTSCLVPVRRIYRTRRQYRDNGFRGAGSIRDLLCHSRQVCG